MLLCHTVGVALLTNYGGTPRCPGPANQPTSLPPSLLPLEQGATDPESLRRLLRKRGADRSLAVGMQLALNASSAAVAWWSGLQIATTHSLGPLTVAGEYIVYVLAMYLTINATLDIFGLVTVGLATRRYSDRSAAFLEAVSALAGPESGLEVVDKARRAVATVQVLGALDQILRGLKAEAGAAAPGDFFRDLGAYLTLARASAGGFDSEKLASLGLSPSEAADIAAEFAMADADDDGTVDTSEFRRVAARLAPGVTQEEAEAAVRVLDTNGDGVVDFAEFVEWWVSKERAPAEAAAAHAAARQSSELI